jgi:hypothetical protein
MVLKQVAHITIALAAFWIGFSQLTVYGYFLANQAEITELFCINKEKPRLKCNGKCHLKSTMETSSGASSSEATLQMVWTEVFSTSDDSELTIPVANLIGIQPCFERINATDKGYSFSIPDPPQVG